MKNALALVLISFFMTAVTQTEASAYSPQATLPIEIQKDIGLAHNFGAVAVGTSTNIHWNLRAKEADLEIQSIHLEGADFTLQSECPAVLPALQKCAVGVTYSPSQVGSHKGLLVIDLYSDRFIIQIQGEGIPAN